MARLRIKDTGLESVSGSEIYTKANSGNWLDLYGFTIAANYRNLVSTNEGHINEDSSNFGHSENAQTGCAPPRYTIRGTVAAADATNILTKLVAFRKSKGVKRLSGGLGVIDADKDGDDTYSYINVIIVNLTISEVLASSTDYIDFTIEVLRV